MVWSPVIDELGHEYARSANALLCRDIGIGGWPAKQGTGMFAVGFKLLRVRCRQVQDAVAVAAQPFEVAGDLAGGFGEAKQQRLGKGLGQGLLLGSIGHAHHRPFRQTAVNKTGSRTRRGCAAWHLSRVLTMRQR